MKRNGLYFSIPIGVSFWILSSLILSACWGANLPSISQLTPDYNVPWKATISVQGKPQISIVTAIPFTPTSTPTKTPIPIPDAEVQVDTANVRSGPGSVYTVLSSVTKGDNLVLIGRNEDETWFVIKMSDNQLGWVSIEGIHININTEPLSIIETPPTPIPPPGKVIITNYLGREAMVYLGQTYFFQNGESKTVTISQGPRSYRVCLYKFVNNSLVSNCGGWYTINVGASSVLQLNSLSEFGISP